MGSIAHDTKASPADYNILIAGGGLAGLLCALECKRQGFNVTVLESKSAVQSAGDFIVVGDTAARGFKNWPHLWKAFHDKVWRVRQFFCRQSGEIGVGPITPGGSCIERSVLHSLLMDAVTVEGIDVRCNQKVVDYVETKKAGSVVLASGETLKADLVIAADGIHSKSWKLVTDEEPCVYSSGEAIFRAAFPVEHALKSPALRERWQADEKGDRMGMFLGPHSHAVMALTSKTASWVWMHKDNPETSSESWTASISSDEALRQIEADGDWASDFKAMVAATPANNIVDWRLMWRDLRPQWVSPNGRIVQIGDAAHAFLPTSVNGATQALEDALSLPTCLRRSIESLESRDAIPVGARVHNKLRLDRVSCLQLFGVKRRNNYRHVDWEAVKEDPTRISYAPPAWMQDHDPTNYAEEMFASCVESLQPGGRTFHNTNVSADYQYEPWSIVDVMAETKDS